MEFTKLLKEKVAIVDSELKKYMDHEKNAQSDIYEAMSYSLMAGGKRLRPVIMLLTAITVSVASRAVGALMISSLLVIPVACAMTFAKSYASMLRISVVFALIFTIAGLFISFYMNLRPGGTIVLLGVITLIILLIANKGGK